MIVNIENLGAIKNASIDLSKKLTVFCGPNNSGKTYVAFVIYALSKYNLKFFKSVLDKDLLKTIIEEKKCLYHYNINEVWDFRASEINDISDGTDNLFGISEEIAKNLFNEFNISIKENKEELNNKLEVISFEQTIKFSDLSVNIIKHSNQNHLIIEVNNKTLSKDHIQILEFYLPTKLLSLLAFYPFSTSYILPVERNSIYTFSKELSIRKQDFLDRAQDLGSNKKSDPFDWLLKRTTRYPMPIRDGLEVAEDLANYNNLKSDFIDFAENIENNLLQGKVILSKDGEVQFCSNKSKRKKIPIHLTASIVKTLSSLVFYLKHIANKNDLIIIDEPELNLHPNNQIVLTRIFAQLINNGFRLLISTHSDYIIRELNNLIMLSSPKEGISELAKKFNYKETECINKDEVGAYLFNYKYSNSKNITVEQIAINEQGFDVKTIDDTINSLNNISEDLYYTLKYGVEDEQLIID
ncbi:hypothetical protein TH61_12750 [Rufibacter sp. DG15C]|uniref:AAA family ATPase n=1 Tax=Rufibacter sp. DG15C TaxID=1379909 RepID=UPI00078CE191|nr:AAA family ATPase [Rufibacter sp. DG15C]AMM51872.1 hypothetical protein TH61_12750 [Rufibacter sp. DG15C]